MAALAYDLLGPDNVLRQLYQNDDFMNFLCDILELEKDGKRLYRSADTLGAWFVIVTLITQTYIYWTVYIHSYINIFRSGWEAAYHFDQSEFTTTLMLQRPEKGGHFLHTSPDFRDKENVVCSHQISKSSYLEKNNFRMTC